MAILGTLFGLIGRFAGKLLNAVLGWASTLLFGRVSKDKQLLLVLITFGSIVWVVLVVGVFVPDVGSILLTFVPVANLIEPYVRILMLIGAIVVPLLIGAATLQIEERAARPTGGEMVKSVLRGYPLAFVLAFVLVFLAAVAVVRKARSLVKRWGDAHVPIVVKPGCYDETAADLEKALDDAGLDVASRPAPAVLAAPAQLMAKVAGGGVRSLVPDRLVQLVGPDLEITLHPSDLAIAGQETKVNRARAACAARLVGAPVYLTTTAEAQQVEDRLERLAKAGVPGPEADAELADIDRALATLDIDYEEWETLYRTRLQVERDLLAGIRPGEDFPGARSDRVRDTSTVARVPASRPAGFATAIAGVTLGALILDLALALRERFAR